MDEAKQEEQFNIAAGIAAVGAFFGGMGLVGWFGDPWSPSSAMIAAALGAIAGGCMEVSGFRARAFSALSFLVGGLTFALATAWYVSGRSSIMKVEMFVPMLIAVVPFGVFRWAFNSVFTHPTGSWTNRHTGALVAGTLFCVLASTAAFSGGTTADPAPHPNPQHVLILDFTAGKQLLHRGDPLDDARLQTTLRQYAEADPSTVVIVRVPRGSDPRPAMAKVLPPAMQLGLDVNSIEAAPQ